MAALEREKIDQTIAKHLKGQKKPSRSSPRKKSQQFRVEEQVEEELTSERVPLQERTEPSAGPISEETEKPREEEILPEPECPQKPAEARNAFEVLKSAKTSNKPVKVKKLTKKATKNKKLEQSSICDSISSSIVNKINGTGAVRKKANTKAKVLKSKSPKKSSDKENTSQELNITRGSVSKTYKPNKKEKPSVSFDQSIPSSPTKKPTQKVNNYFFEMFLTFNIFLSGEEAERLGSSADLSLLRGRGVRPLLRLKHKLPYTVLYTYIVHSPLFILTFNLPMQCEMYNS